MRFDEVFMAMKQGAKAKLPSWGGYWYWDNEKKTIIIHTKDGDELDIRETQVRTIRSQISHPINGFLRAKKIARNLVE